MDIKIIINSVLIIFILHIIILNINFHKIIGKKESKESKENFNNNSNNSNENSMNFLTSNDSNEDFKKKLLKYIQQDNIEFQEKESEFENKNINIKNIESSNTYLSDNNEPNFESNVADISKFYKINYDNETEIKSTPIMELNKVVKADEIKINENCDTSRKSEVVPNNWLYKNELPMNGGEMNGIFGFDSLESQFAIYSPNKLNIESSNNNNFNNIPHDDLRKPIVYEN